MNEPTPKPSPANESFDTALVVGILGAAGGYFATISKLPLFSDGMRAIGKWTSHALLAYRVPLAPPEVVMACMVGLLAFMVTLALWRSSDPMERHAEKLKARRDSATRRKLDQDRFVVR